ncbi:MAG: cytochrome c [Oceanospirillales bacterium]|nr:cytochrome c [Oceanospirillales bacterium]
MQRGLHLLLLAATGLSLSACSEPSPEQLSRGDELYAYYCQNCHQQQGLGPLLEQLPLTPRSLKRHEIILMIKHGYSQGHGSMPVFPQLSDTQADAIAHYILQQRPRQPRQHN